MSIITNTTMTIVALELSMGTIDTICLSCGEANVVNDGPLARLWRRYCELAAKRRSRIALDEMSDWQLRDIGVSEADARREASIPFWR